ncbi:YciI family protein [Nocardiopsis alba]|uniref:YCII-related domain-containing protein n=1 Tax=Nocardiopsis alba TaxID=53437 RepID=A0A7K2INU0_9ACTN|nr:YciI family protein [Nocardiopsis sp. LDBS1602]MEC3894037.1 YciI family protein [Nocardiopsis sp. LDBS1602]MYR31652.1 hypothetical protein [Nocardiopsis alba]
MTPNRFIVHYSPGPSWVEGVPLFEQPLQGHAEYQRELLGKGLLEFSGPFLDRDGGMAVLVTGDETEARRVTDNDPAVLSGVFAVDVAPLLIAVQAGRAE